MNFIKGYKAVGYEELQADFNAAFKESGKSPAQLAADTDINSTTTIYSAFNKEEQLVSDKILTSLFRTLQFEAFIMWQNGEKLYFMKSKN